MGRRPIYRFAEYAKRLAKHANKRFLECAGTKIHFEPHQLLGHRSTLYVRPSASIGDKGMACNISLHLTSRHSSLRQLSVDELYTYLLISKLISDHISRVASVDGLSQGAIRPQCD